MDEALIRRIEAASLWAWPPRETRFLDGWLLRAADCITNRVNSVRTNDWAGHDLDRALAEVEAWYAARGKAACLMLNDLAQPPGLDARLADRGYARLPSVSVQVMPPPADPPATAIELLHRPTPAVMNVLCDPHLPPAARRGRAALLARIRRPHRFGLVSQGGEPLAAGLCVLEGELAGMFAVRTVVPQRGHGLARAIVTGLGNWAMHQGATIAYAQVEDDNMPARALYRRFGPRRVYGYHYRRQ